MKVITRSPGRSVDGVLGFRNSASERGMRRGEPARHRFVKPIFSVNTGRDSVDERSRLAACCVEGAGTHGAVAGRRWPADQPYTCLCRRSVFRAQGPSPRRRAPCLATRLASLTPSVSDPDDFSPHALHTLSDPLQRFVTVDRVKRASLDTRW